MMRYVVRIGLLCFLALVGCQQGSIISLDHDSNPIAAFNVDPAQALSGSVLTFDASASTGNIQSYDWNFGDGTTGSGKIVTHQYGSHGSYMAVLQVTDSHSSKATAGKQVVG